MKQHGPRLLWNGYGAGLTLQQATEAIRAIPQLLSMHHEDSKKPSILYFYQQLQVPYEEIDAARNELSDYLIGTEAGDACTFAHLHNKLGISWYQMRLLLEAFPTLTCCDTDPGWELFDHGGPVRSVLKEDGLFYLRKRLQVGSREIFGMLK
eukprot:14341381-Ditylum_brightwellii.AAC.1